MRTSLDVSAPEHSLCILDWTCYLWTLLCHVLILYEHILQRSSMLCNWLSLWCLVSRVTHLHPVCWSTLLEIKFEIIVGFEVWHNGKQLFHFFVVSNKYLNASQYQNTLFSLTLFSYLKSCLYSTQYFSTLILYKRLSTLKLPTLYALATKLCFSHDLGAVLDAYYM